MLIIIIIIIIIIIKGEGHGKDGSPNLYAAFTPLNCRFQSILLIHCYSLTTLKYGNCVSTAK